MADEAEVEVADEGVVEVDLGAEAVAKKATAAEEVKPQPRLHIKEIDGHVGQDDATKVLQAAVDNEKKLRAAAEQTATNARQQADQERNARLTREQELDRTRQALEQRELSVIEAGIEGATREIAATQKELAAALAAGEFEKVAEVQTRMSKATAALDRFEGKKADFESSQQSKIESSSEAAPVQSQPTPFERYVAGMEPAAQTWLRAHPECAPAAVGGKGDMNAKMMRGHYDALSQGFSPNSENYFRVIEESTGFRKPEAVAEEEVAQEQPRPKQRQAQPSAPPSRDPPGSQQTGSTRTVRLSKDEQEAARISFPNLEPSKAFAEYARNKVILDSEGKLGRTSH